MKYKNATLSERFQNQTPNNIPLTTFWYTTKFPSNAAIGCITPRTSTCAVRITTIILWLIGKMTVMWCM